MRRSCLLSLLLAVLFVGLPARTGAAKDLADDGRAGVVLEVQGTALLRPAGAQRWTPLAPKSVLFPGDIVRTRPRGAHALELALRQGRMLVGPGAELQLQADGTPRLLRGEAEVVGSPETPQPVAAAGGFSLEVRGTAWLRARDNRTERLDAAPRWVEGYHASASDEWMGSLLANVDGRPVPLAVGYHKVDVEVRDQIARTTVEQSFVNGTKEQLEGVFYFPLPADASISGFGMWIGGELVEADIVERQRARQIYEDILRRKKDPGLLEWEGGNIFKARVFPIQPHAEKRIRIQYTQVLPLEGDTWRYRYALRSELLQSRPLRELQIAVRVVSTQPLQTVASPTHEITLHRTDHEATAEYRASEVRPSRDFELAVQVDRSRAVTVVPHRRGEDGYFMLMVAPPAPEGDAWQRELAPEGKPLDVLLLADTSGSMDDGARRNQAAFLEGLLALLGTRDRFRLAAFDADVAWLVEEATAPDDETVRAALEALASRRSLGWTDLDAGVAAALEAAGPDTLVVYVGDGVGTTGDADAAAQAARLRALGSKSRASVHAVAASSSYEQGVLEALAETGGGSVRTLGARPVEDAYALLTEVARPSVKDLRVSIEGLRTARVYPARLPNLPLGRQQVVLGRFLPAATPQEARVVVEGTLDGTPVRYAADVRIPAADVGNSFLPRLWGRRHIDALLAQGGSEVQEELVAFSERFGIMTPLTSFLVLESDEDRERYGVARRVRMRDGERFFTEAKNRAMLEQRRDLMRDAGRWRQGLRRHALEEIARLGRDLPIYAAPAPRSLEVAVGDMVSGFGFTSFGRTAFADADGDTFFTDNLTTADTGLSLDRAKVLEAEGLALREEQDKAGAPSWGLGGGGDGAPRHRGSARRSLGADAGAPTGGMPSAPVTAEAPMRQGGGPAESGGEAGEELERAADLPPGDLDDVLEELGDRRARRRPSASPTSPAAGFLDARRGYAGKAYARLPGLREPSDPTPPPPSPAFSLQSLGFPAVPPPPRPAEDGGAELEGEAEALAILRTLPRRDDLRRVEGGVHVLLRREGLHPTRQAVLGGATVEAWLGTDAWRVRQGSTGFDDPTEAWSHDGVRGVLARARQLARTREARPTDDNAWWLPVWDLRARDVLRAWAQQGYRAALVRADGEEAVVELRRRHPDERVLQLAIDRTRRVITETRWIDATGRTRARLVRSDFTEVAGRHWARTVERFDERDRRVERRALTLQPLAPEALQAALEALAPVRAEALAVHGRLPARHEAKDAVRARRAGFVDHLVLCVDLGQQQRTAESLDAWRAAAAAVPDKDGRRWVEAVLLERARRGQDWFDRVRTLLPPVRARGGADGRFLAAWLAGLAARTLGPNEQAVILDGVREAWVDAESPQAALRQLRWQQAHVQLLDAANRVREARALRAALAQAWPHRVGLQLRHEADLWSTGQVEAALAFLDDLLATREPWTEGERSAIYLHLADRLWERRELEALHERLSAWIATGPEDQAPWWMLRSSLYLLGREAEADAQVLADLALGLGDDDPRAHTGRVGAAVSLALGQGWQFQVDHVHPPFLAPLHDTLLRHMRRTARRPGFARTIHDDWRFRRTDRWRAAQQALFGDLTEDEAVAALPRHVLERYLALLPWGPGGAPDEVWETVRGGVHARWSAATDPHDRQAWEAALLQLLDARQQREAAVGFLEAALARAMEARDGQAPRIARALAGRLLQGPDHDPKRTHAWEDRLFALLPLMLDPTWDEDRRAAAAAADVRRLADRLYRWRFADAYGTPEAREGLSRAALALRKRTARTEARGAVAARLRAAEGAAAPLHAPWLQIERLGYAVEHGEELAAIVTETRGILARDWVRPDPEVDPRPLERLLRERAAVILTYAATRGNTTPAIVDVVRATFEAGLAAEPEGGSEAERVGRALLDWRAQLWRLLVARDDVPALEAALRAWIVPAKADSRWRIALGYLLAETGRVQEAAAQFQVVSELDELGAADYAALADWYLVLDEDARRDRALQARYDHMNEGQLTSLFWNLQRQATSRAGGVPGDFDPELVRVGRALMTKASYPANHVWRLRNLYRQTKDWRVLAPTAQGLVGHSKEAVYAFLRQITELVGEVHEEASLDAWEAELDGLTPATALDRRALQLAMARIAARAGLVAKADPEHARRAVAALKSSFEHDFVPGERELLAYYLRDLGTLRDPAAQAEQLRQLAALEAAEPAGSLVRLRIASAHASTLWAHGDHGGAIDVIASALGLVRREHDGRVPMAAVRIFDQHVNWLASRGRFADAERILLAERDRWDLPMRRRGLTGRLYVLYVDALGRGGLVSLGRGTALFEATARLMAAGFAAEPALMGQTLGTWCNLHRVAQKAGRPADAGARLEAWGREALPKLLRRLPLQAASHTGTVAGTVRELRGPEAGLRLLLARHEAEPSWLTRVGYTVWQQQTYNLARWRREGGRMPSLEPALEALVVAQLEHNLVRGGSRGQWFYDRGNKWSWPERFGVFADTTSRVAELHPDDESVQVRCASTLRSRLGRTREGADLLAAAQARGLLGERSRWTLARWLHADRRNEEALAVMDGLVAERPQNLGYRTHRIAVLAALHRDDAARAALVETAEAWHAREQWNESVAATLGAAAAKHGFPGLAEGWLEEAIRLRRDARGNRGGRDSTLARYYRSLALARAKLGKAEPAVQAASTALLMANPRSRAELQVAERTLQEALAALPSLPAYVEAYDAQVEETRMDTPILRKAFARVFEQREEHAAEVVQLRLARELEPRDAEIHTRLVAAHDALGDAAGAIEALFASLRLNPRDASAYLELGRRLEAAGRTAEAERTRTTLAEYAPQQPDGHRALAELRGSQRRSAEAVVQWRQVVRTGRLDPTGHLGLARALLATGERAEARTVLEGVIAGSWEDRFGDVKAEAARLLAAIGRDGDGSKR